MLAAMGAMVVLVACVLPWYTTSGVGLPPTTRDAFDGAGIIVFAVALLVLTLIVLPYAAGDQPLGVDRPLSFALAAGLGVVGLGLRVIQQLGYGDPAGMYPDRAPGLWLAGLGLAIIAWGVTDIAAAKGRA